MDILEQPLTLKQLEAKSDENGYISVVIPVSLTDIIGRDIEGLNDLAEQRIVVPNAILSNIGYRVVGHRDEDTILLGVTAVAEVIL